MLCHHTMTIPYQTIDYNNAGVQCLDAGHVDAARDLFRAALETKVASERASTQTPTLVAVSNLQRSNETTESSECILHANYHLTQLQQYLQQPSGPSHFLTSITSNPDSITSNQSMASISDQTIALTNRTSSSREPALYDRGFAMRRDCGDSDQCFGAVNIFNLGLVHHLQDGASDKARAFYQVASAIMIMESGETGIPPANNYSILLRAAIFNNLGVWNHDNGDEVAARDSFHGLANLLTATATHHMNGNPLASEPSNPTGVNVFYVLLCIIASSPDPS